MATAEGPGSWPAYVLPAVAVKWKLSAVSWPFRALGTEGARELLPGPVPTLLKRCKQGPVLGEGNNWRKETFSAGRDVRGGRRCREAVSQITLAEKEIGLINEEKASSSRWKSLRNIFQVAYFLQVLNFHSAHNSSPQHSRMHSEVLGRGLGRGSSLHSLTPPSHHPQPAGGLEALQAFTSLPSSLALNLGKSCPWPPASPGYWGYLLNKDHRSQRWRRG